MIHQVAFSSYYKDSYQEIAYMWTLDDLADALELIELQEDLREKHEMREEQNRQMRGR